MSDYAQYAPLVVPILVGLILLRLVFGLLLAHTKRGAARAEAVRRSWGQFTTALFFAAVILPIIKTSVGLPIATIPFWPLLIVGLIGNLHHAVLTTQMKAGGMPSKPATKPAAKASAKAATNNPSGVANPANADQPAPVIYSTSTRPQTFDRAISQAPLPQAGARRAEPMPSERAEAWYALQDAKLQAGLEGKELAAARLRLSTLKSMLLLGQIGTSDADGDINMVLKQAGRG